MNYQNKQNTLKFEFEQLSKHLGAQISELSTKLSSHDTQLIMLSKDFNQKVNVADIVKLKDTIINQIKMKTIEDQPFLDLIEFVKIEMKKVTEGKDSPEFIIKAQLDIFYQKLKPQLDLIEDKLQISDFQTYAIKTS